MSRAVSEIAMLGRMKVFSTLISCKCEQWKIQQNPCIISGQYYVSHDSVGNSVKKNKWVECWVFRWERRIVSKTRKSWAWVLICEVQKWMFIDDFIHPACKVSLTEFSTFHSGWLFNFFSTFHSFLISTNNAIMTFPTAMKIYLKLGIFCELFPPTPTIHILIQLKIKKILYLKSWKLSFHKFQYLLTKLICFFYVVKAPKLN